MPAWLSRPHQFLADSPRPDIAAGGVLPLRAAYRSYGDTALRARLALNESHGHIASLQPWVGRVQSEPRVRQPCASGGRGTSRAPMRPRCRASARQREGSANLDASRPRTSTVQVRDLLVDAGRHWLPPADGLNPHPPAGASPTVVAKSRPGSAHLSASNRSAACRSRWWRDESGHGRTEHVALSLSGTKLRPGIPRRI